MAIWVGDAPGQCDICKRLIEDEFYDASIPMAGGSWANVCPRCFKEQGCTLGMGRGQHYKKQGDKFVRVAGGR